MKQAILSKPLFLVLLPLYFVLHGFLAFYNLVPVKDASLLFLYYTTATILLTLFLYLIFRKWYKAALFSFALMAYFFFFGAMQDFLLSISSGGFISRYTFILPLSLLFFIFLFIRIRRLNAPQLRTVRYLNLLFLVLMAADGILFAFRKLPEDVPASALYKTMTFCDSCDRPDIYLLVADGYPGKQELKDQFGYDNTYFEQQLKDRGFHITDSSHSNYNFTPFSMASMLRMRYLEKINGSNSDHADIRTCYAAIRQNPVFRYLRANGYRLYNYSIFDVKDEPSRAIPTFLPVKTRPITSQTFFHRLEKNLGHLLITRLNIRYFQRRINAHDLRNNEKLETLTRETSAAKTAEPKFVYTHLVMPHYPYYFDSTGHKVPLDSLTDAYAKNMNAFISYLAYSNKQLLSLVDDIRHSSSRPPVILLMSDHGFREFPPGKEPDAAYYYMNLNAVYLPDGDYSRFYTGMSNINQFRVLMNTLFSQQIPLLRDSTVLIRE